MVNKGNIMEIKISKETLQECFYKAMNNIEIETGMDLKECVEKQIPKTPHIVGDGYADGHIAYDIWHCPCCDHMYEIDIDDYKYCPECGQRIDWSDDNPGEENENE